MEHINITNADIVKNLDETTKHNMANYCLVNNINPKDVVEPIKNIVNVTINTAIDICNSYFNSPIGKEYLNIRKNIENLK